MGIYTGVQLLLFQFGGGGYRSRGDVLLPTSPGVVAPLLWVMANPNTLAMAPTCIDFYSGTVLEGTDTIEEAGEILLQLVVGMASGTLTKAETIKHQDPTQVYMKDPIY
jgi:altronate dehydratase